MVRVSRGGDEVGAVEVNSGCGRGRSGSESFLELRARGRREVKSTDWCFRFDRLQILERKKEKEREELTLPKKAN